MLGILDRLRIEWIGAGRMEIFLAPVGAQNYTALLADAGVWFDSDAGSKRRGL